MSRSIQHEGLSKKTAYPGVIRSFTVRMTRDSERRKASLVSNESLIYACHVSLLFNAQGNFVS